MVKGWLAFVIVGLLIIPFAFWGINYYFDQGGELSAATVNGEDISLRDYQRTYQSIRQQWQSISGGNFQEGIDAMLKQQAVENIVQRELLKQTNKDVGLRVSDAQVRKTIDSIDYFRGIDGFDQRLYESALSQLGFTPASFEAQIRQDAMADQLQSAVTGTAFVTDDEVFRFASLKNQTRDISYTIFSSNELKETIEVSDEDIESYYQKDNSEFQEPEKVSISYVVLSLDKISEAISVDESDLLAYYEANKAIYSVEEQRKIKQLMVSFPDDSSDADREKTEAIAAEIHGFLSAGQSFEDVANQYLDKEDVSVEFSEFGFLTRGILEGEVDETAFALAAGEFSQPIRSEVGLHIVSVDEIKGVETSGFDSIREEVENDYKSGEAEKRFYDLSDQLASMAFEQPDTLEVLSTELELEIQNSDLFSRNQPGAGIISDPKIVTASFSDEVLLNGNNSDVIELDENRNVVLRIKQHQPEMKKPLAEVRERILTRIKYERASEQVRKQGEAILAEIREGKDKAEIADKHALEWQEATGVKRDDAGIDRTILTTAFRLASPKDGQVFSGGVSLASGDYVVVRLNAVQEPARDSFETEEISAIRAQLERLQANSNWALFLKDIREEAKVTIYSESL